MVSRVLALAAILLLTAAGAFAQETDPEEDLLVLSVHLAGHLLADDLVAYGHSEGVLLPLQRLAELLDLPLEVDLERREWALGARTGRFEPALAQVREGDVFLDGDFLSSWLAIDFTVDRGALRLEIKPREKLSIQEKWEREARRRDLQFLRSEDGRPPQPRFALQDHPYGLVGWPTIDGNVSFALGLGQDGPTTAVRHSVLARGDLLAMTAGLFVSGDEARLTLERPLASTEWKIGDVAMLLDPLLSRGRPGRGILISRSPGSAWAAGSERTVLAGDALPGWDVELYRNGALLDFQRVGEDGRYEFRDIPLQNGMNLFLLAFYGPRGERREREERIFVSHDLLPAGAASWRAGLLQPGAGLLQAPYAEAPGDALLPGSFLGSFELERGLSRLFSWSFGLTSLTLTEGRHDYLGFGLRTAWPGGSGQLRLTRDLGGGWAGQLQTRGGLGAVQFEADHVELRDFRSDGEEARRLRSRSRVRLFSQAPLPGRFFHGITLPLSLTATRQVTAREENLTLQATGALSFPVGSSFLGSQWRLDFSGSDLSAGGSLLLNSRFRRLGLRGNLSYQLAPEPALSDLTFQAETTLGETLTGRFGVSHGLRDSTTSLSAGLDWKQEHFLLGLSLGLTSRGRVELGGSLSFSLGRDPQDGRFRMRRDSGASQGGVSARVFLDADNDGRFGPGDSPLPEARVEAQGGALTAVTGEDGVAWLQVPPYRPVDLSISEKSLADPTWVPGRSGVSLVPRPGAAWAVDFPVIVTGEIEGTVFLRQGEARREASNVRVQLLDADGVVIQEVRSQFDGFYLFERVPPGEYSIRIDPGQLERLGLEAMIEKSAIDLRSGEIRGGVEIILHSVVR